jgi:hypothetical protein
LWGAKGGSAGAIGVGTNQFNVAIGTHAMEGSGPSEKGTYVGTEAGQGVVIGQKNSGFGSWSLNRINGNHNSGFGAYAGFMTATITGNGNTFIGPSTGVQLGTLAVNNVMVIGNPSAISSTGGYRPTAQSNTVYLGSVGDIVLTQDWDGSPKTVRFNASGLTYGANYSSGFSARSIPDTGYVTGLTKNILYYPNIVGYLGASGVDGSITTATAVDRIPTTALAVGTRISAIVTISGTERRLYTAELVTPANATANIELSPSVIRPNDFNATTNNKVWREIKSSGIVDVSNFGVVPDASVSVSDQINAIITAVPSGSTLIFPPSGGNSYRCFGLTVNKKLHFVGFGAKIQWLGLSANMMNISVDGCTIRGFEFVGQGRNNATYINQGAIRLTSCSNVLIQDCTFDQMPYYCILTNTTHISDTSSDFGGINIVNCHMMRSRYGFYAETRGEYVQLVGCTITDCNTGTYIGAGNINFTGCQILDCSVVGIQLAPGVNDAHGLFSGCQINHNAKSIIASGITNGHFFRGCNFYFGDMEFTSCLGITFDNCTIGGLFSKWDKCTGGTVQNSIIDNRNASTVLDSNWNNPSTVFSYNNKDLYGTFVSGWNLSTTSVNGVNVTSSYTANTNSEFIGVSATTALQVYLPLVPKAFQKITIKDTKGNGFATNTTINGNGKLIDGSSTALINTDYGTIQLIYNSVGWSVIGYS